MDNVTEETRVLTDDEIRALFEGSVSALNVSKAAVPKEELYATLKELASNPEREHMLPMFLSVFKRLYVDDVFVDVGISSWKINLAKEELSFGRNESVQLVQPSLLVNGLARQKDKVNENQFIFI